MSFKKSLFMLLLSGGGVIGLTQCVSLTATVPLVGPKAVAMARSHGIGNMAGIAEEDDSPEKIGQMLQHGRRLYLNHCARCHTVVPIGKHSVRKWETIFPDMFEEAKLTVAQQRAVRAYVLAMRRTLP